MKKVLLVTRSLTGGGAERVAASLATFLQDRYEVLLVVIDGSRQTYETEAEKIILNLSVSNKGTFYKRIKWFTTLYREFASIRRKFNPDCVISFLTESELVNALTSKQSRSVTSIRNVRSSVVHGRLKMFRDKWVFSRMNEIVSLSVNAKEDLIVNYDVPDKKIKVIYNICEKKRIAQKIRENGVLESEVCWFGEHTLITLGRLTEQKAQWHMIRAFTKVLQDFPDAKLVILGEGPQEEYLRRLISEYKIENSVGLLGYKSNPYPYLANSTGFVFSSIFEGLGNSIIEALACGLPVISTDCNAGPREILAPDSDFSKGTERIEYAEYGILTPVCDGEKYQSDDPLTYEEEQLAIAMKKILSDQSLRCKYAQKAEERGHQFDKEQILQQWYEVIEG